MPDSAETRLHKITLIPGDGIGPEVTAATVAILEAAGKQTGCAFEWHRFDAGADAYEKTGEYIPHALMSSIKRNKVALKGPVTTPVGGGFSSINVQLRKKFDLYANFRPVKSLPGLKTNYPNVDLVIFRENTEDLYAGLEVMVQPGVAQSLKIIAERYPEITYIEHIVDNTCMQLVLNPYQYDVILTENLYGDILSDLCSAFVGGLGLVPGANLGIDGAIFEAVHGSAPDIAGQNKANPTALLQSAVLMLDHLEETETAQKIQAAIEKVYAEGKTLTRDVGGSAGTKEFGEAVIAAL
jgi:isocitrate dehydrogenase (NAD+)